MKARPRRRQPRHRSHIRGHRRKPCYATAVLWRWCNQHRPCHVRRVLSPSPGRA